MRPPVSRHTGVPVTSVRSYFDILKDTFIGFLLRPWRGSRRREAVATAKFYFFDVGVANFLRGIRTLNRNSTEYGVAFEHFLAMELRSYLSYRRIRSELIYWRMQSGLEVDFLIGSSAAIEVKASPAYPTAICEVCAPWPKRTLESLVLVSFDELDRRTDDGIRLCIGARSLKNCGATPCSLHSKDAGHAGSRSRTPRFGAARRSATARSMEGKVTRARSSRLRHYRSTIGHHENAGATAIAADTPR